MLARTREVLLEALRRYGAEGASDFFALYGTHPSRRSPRTATSRQARHARAQRQRPFAVAGALAIIHDDPSYADVLLDPAFARLRPYSAPVHTRALHLAEQHSAYTRSDAGQIWARLLPEYVDRVRRISQLSRDELLVVHSLQAAISLGFLVLPRQSVRDSWRSIHAELERAGVLKNASTRLWFAIVGSHAGESGSHVDWLLDARIHDFDLADTLCFVRKDTSEELLDETASIIRGDDVSSERWRPLIEEAPLPSWLRLADYVRACSRMPVHCTNEGQVLMVLSWVDDLKRRLEAQTGSLADVNSAAVRLLDALRQIEAVQILEKNRFIRVLTGTEGPLRERLKRLWEHTTPPPEDWPSASTSL